MDTPEEPADETGRRNMDSEILMISRILRMLADLDDAARCRVMQYLSSRYSGVQK